MEAKPFSQWQRFEHSREQSPDITPIPTRAIFGTVGTDRVRVFPRRKRLRLPSLNFSVVIVIKKVAPGRA